MNKQTHSLMPLLFDPKRLGIAARQCMRRRSSPGCDKVRWKDYRNDYHRNLAKLSQRLKMGTWSPAPVRILTISSITGKTFRIAIPTVEDRIVQRAMRNIIEPILDCYALEDFVSGFRYGRNRLTSIRQAMGYFEQGYTCVADVDVKDVSRNVDVAEVIEWLSAWISDGAFLRRIEVALAGLPAPIFPGGGLSPLLINLRLVPVDRQITQNHLKVVRFADNYCIFCKRPEEAEQAFEMVVDCLVRQGLNYAAEKSAVKKNVNPEDLFLIAG